MKNSFTYLRKLEEFKCSESYQLFLSLLEHRQVISILRINYRELITSISAHNQFKYHSKFWNNKNPKFRKRIQLNIIRLLSNYLSNVSAVIDYSRKHSKKYNEHNSSLFETFKLEIKTNFDLNPHHKFLQDLRNYISHNTYLKINSEYSLNILWDRPKKNIFLKKEELLKWENWNKLSRNFIDSSDKNIYILDVIQTHFVTFIKFQNWCYLALIYTHKDFVLQHKKDTKKIFAESLKSNLFNTLPFNESYFRYLDYLIKQSTSKFS